ncbi:MAG: T9SS type B sorting domain-containing protein [Bacteroidia bacterium]
MKNLFSKTLFVIAFFTMNLFSPCIKAQCLQVESILVDACNYSPCAATATEGENEMVLLKVGNADLTVGYMSSTATASLIPTWPNNSFKGWQTPGPLTTPLVAALNSTIVKCGYLKEPVGGVLPANAEVLLITSTDMCTSGNSFANLTDTLYVLFQVAGNTLGHFVNNNNSSTITTIPTGASSTRTLTVAYTGTVSCTDAVVYDRSLLVNIYGTYGGTTNDNNGSAVTFDAAGVASYINNGCLAPYIPTTVTATAPSTVCVNSTANLNGEVSGPAVNYTWTTSGTGAVSIPTGTLSGSGTTTLTPTYTPGANESGTVTFTLTAQGKCTLSVTTATVAINVIALPSPTVASSAGTAICNGNSTTLSVNNEPGVTYSWNPGAGSGTSFSVNPTSQTIYTLTASNSCASINATYTIDVNALPVISIASASVCPGATATLTASGASTYTWSTSVVSNTLSASPANTTTYSASGTDLNGCVGAGTGTITIFNPPTVTVNSPATCIGGTVTLNANGALTFTWSTTQNGNSISVSPAVGTTDYTVTGTDANGCDNFAVASVTINPLPTIIANPVAICPGNTATLTASGASTYTWNTNATGATFTDNPSVSTNYTVTGTDANGCVNTTTTSISVVNTLTVTATPGTTTICNGSSATITAGGASSYTWTPSSSLSSGNGTSVTASPTVMTTYTVVGSSGSCKDSTTFAVNVNALPNVTAAATATAVCGGTSVTLNGGGAQTYTWSNGVTDGVSFIPTSTQTYTVNGTDVNGCVNSATVAVTVINLTITATSSAPSVCIGSSATLTANGATNYTWSPAASLSSANGSTVTATPTSTVPVTYTVVGVTGACSVSTTVTFSVNPLPVITATASAVSVCQGGTVTVSASGAFIYVWTGGVSTGVPFTPSSTQTYSVIGMDMNGCASNMTSVTVSVTPSPAITVSPSQTVCAGSSATFTVSGATTYTWTGAQNGTSLNVSPSSGINTYTVQGTDANGCLSNVASTDLTVNPIATISVTSVVVCPGATATLTASGATTYTWSPSTGLSITTGSLVTSTTASTTVYTVTGNYGSCPATPATATVTVNPVPVITVTPSQNICAGDPVTLSAVGALTYTWMPGNSHSSTITVIPGSSTTFTVTGTSAAGCTATGNVTSVNVNPTPTVSFVPDPSGGQAPLAVTFSNTSSGTGALSSYWNFGNGDTSTITNPHETFNQPGSYGVVLVVTDANGCKDTAITTIIVTDAPVVIIIPNVFTPNGDGINDVFSITGVGISNFNCRIYDRWGIFLYEWSDLKGGWDGKNVSNGKEVTDGTYYYIIKYLDDKLKAYTKQGYLQLIR